MANTKSSVATEQMYPATKPKELDIQTIKVAILDALSAEPGGLSRSEIRDLFARHNYQMVEQALSELEQMGMARMEKVKTGGRPVEQWYSSSGGLGGSVAMP